MEHDHPFKDLLETFLPEFVSLFLPAEAAQIDWTNLQFIRNETFTDLIQGERRTLDVVAEVRTLTGEPELILVHVEVEADPRANFPERMYEYYTVLRLRRRLRVLPLAVYLRPGFGGITRGRYEESIFGLRTVQFEYHVAALPDVPLAQLPPLNPVTHALAPLLAGRPADRVELLLDSLHGIDRTAPDPARQELLTGFLSHYLHLSPEELAEMRRRIEYTEHKEIRPMTTIFHELGRAEGRTEQAQRMLMRLLEARFGVPPTYLKERLNHLSEVAQLEELVLPAATAATLEEFEAHLPPNPG